MSYSQTDDGGSGFLIGFITGAALGAGLALLYAPRPGADMRREVAERAQTLGKRASEQYEAASERVHDLAERGRDAYQTAAEKARELADRGRRDLHDAADKAHEVVDRVSGAAAEAKADVEAAGAAAAKKSAQDVSDRLG